MFFFLVLDFQINDIFAILDKFGPEAEGGQELQNWAIWALGRWWASQMVGVVRLVENPGAESYDGSRQGSQRRRKVLIHSASNEVVDAVVVLS